MKKILLIFAISLLTIACTTEEALDYQSGDIIGLGGEDFITTDIDVWIAENVTKLYNIDVKYRWDQSEVNLDSRLVPIKEQLVIPVLQAIRRIWIEPYEAVGGENFIKILSPKKYVLIGSPRYSSGNIILGEAEGGRKISLYRLNWYNAADADMVRDVLKTVHHEYAHSMHQTVMYPLEFKSISAVNYNSSWTGVKESVALAKGFVSPYAGSAPDEDFAEMVARTIVFGKSWWDKKVSDAAAYYADPSSNADLATVEFLYDPSAALKSKMAIIESYMKNVWGVQFFDKSESVDGAPIPQEDKGLVTLVQEAITSYVADNQ